MTTNLYSLLGLTTKATPSEIRKAYQKLAMKFHPDRNPGNPAAEEMFKSIKQAYEILSDEQRRLTYDQTGSTESNFASPESQARQILSQMFCSYLDRVLDSGLDNYGDPIESLRKEINRQTKEGNNTIAKKRRKVKDLEKVLSKHLKGRAAAEPWLEEAGQAKLQQERSQLEGLEQAIKIGALMLEILKQYSWEGEQVKSKPPTLKSALEIYELDIEAFAKQFGAWK